MNDILSEQASLLLVDDDATFCRVLSAALKKRGYQVEIGDWFGQKGGSGLFSEQMSL